MLHKRWKERLAENLHSSEGWKPTLYIQTSYVESLSALTMASAGSNNVKIPLLKERGFW
jgi:hypothetical protein